MVESLGRPYAVDGATFEIADAIDEWHALGAIDRGTIAPVSLLVQSSPGRLHQLAFPRPSHSPIERVLKNNSLSKNITFVKLLPIRVIGMPTSPIYSHGLYIGHITSNCPYILLVSIYTKPQGANRYMRARVFPSAMRNPSRTSFASSR